MSRERKPIDLRRTLHFVERVGKANVHDSETKQNFAPGWKGAIRGDMILRHPGAFKFKHKSHEDMWLTFLGTLEDEVEVTKRDLEAFTVKELQALAVERGVSVDAKARKAEIITAIQDAE